MHIFLDFFLLILFVAIPSIGLCEEPSIFISPRNFTISYTNGSSYSSDELCIECFLNFVEHIPPWPTFKYLSKDKIELSYLPKVCKENLCKLCNFRNPVYFGYYSFSFLRKFPFLERQIAYCKKYPFYESYWPETSPKAKFINDVAYELFQDLYFNAGLDLKEGGIFSDFPTAWWHSCLDMEGRSVPISLTCTCFRLSDYYQEAQDLKLYALSHLSESDYVLLESRLNEIINILSPLFLWVYAESLCSHPTLEIAQEIEFIKYLHQLRCDRDLLSLISFSQNTIKKYKNILINMEIPNELISGVFWDLHNISIEYFFSPFNSDQPKWFLANLFFLKGIYFSNVEQNESAISSLTEAIHYHPFFLDA